MIKVKYIGDVSPGRVSVFNSSFLVKTGDILELDEKSAKKLTENPNYIIIAEEKIEIKDKQEYKIQNVRKGL